MPTDEAYLVREIESLKRQMRELPPSIAKSFRSTVADLKAQAAHLASLKTTSAGGTGLNSGDQPGDQTWRWIDDAPPLTLEATAATGTLNVTVGCGQVTLAPGDTSAVASVSFAASTPSGWSYNVGATDARLYSESSRRIGVPLMVTVPLTVPTDEPVTITAKFGIWSASTTALASAEFADPYITAQVIDRA